MLIAVIPNDVLLGICSLWLRKRDVIRVDTSVCNEKYRQQILEILKSGIISLDCYDNVGFWNWIFLRQFKLIKLSFCSTLVRWDYIDVSKVHTVKCNFGWDNNDEQIENFVDMINRCVELRNLNLDNFVSILRIKPCLLEHLTSLHTCDETIDDFLYYANNCKNLVTIEMSPRKKVDINNHEFEVLFANNPKIIRFVIEMQTRVGDFKINSDVILQLIKQCPELCDLQLLNVKYDGLIDDQLLASIVSKQNWANIEITSTHQNKNVTFVLSLVYKYVVIKNCSGFSSINLALFFRKFNYLFDINIRHMEINDSLLNEISTNNVVTSLRLTDCHNDYTENGMECMLDECSMLKALHIDCHAKFVTQLLSSYVSVCGGLRKLTLYNVYEDCTLVDIGRILKNHPECKELTVVECDYVLAKKLKGFFEYYMRDVRLRVHVREN